MKKMLSFTLALILVINILPLMGMQKVYAEETDTATILPGDCNEDYSVDAKDVLRLRRYLSGGWDAPDNAINEIAADVNGEGAVNAKDITRLRRFLAGGWPNEVPTLYVPEEESDTYHSSGDYVESEYDPATLRDSEDIVDLEDDVFEIVSTSEVNVVHSYNAETNSYFFSNADDSLKNLEIGDKLTVPACDILPDGAVIIVKESYNNLRYWVIVSEEVELDDIVENIDIAEIVPITEDMVVEYGEFVTPILEDSPSTLSYSCENSDDLAIKESSVNLKPIKLSINIPLTTKNSGASASISGKIELAPSIKVDINMRESRFLLSLDNKMASNIKFKSSYENQIFDMGQVYRISSAGIKQKYANRNLSAADCADYRTKLYECKFPIATSGLSITCAWYAKITANGQLYIEASYTQNNSLGVKFENGKWKDINTESKSLSVKGNADASVYAGVGIQLGLYYAGIASATLDPEVGIQITAATEFDENLLTKGKTSTAHNCYFCVDGDIYSLLSINTSIQLGPDWLTLYQYAGNLYSNTSKLGDFYITVGGPGHKSIAFGWGECPYDIEPEPSIETKKVSLTKENPSMTFKLTPSVSGIYIFESSNLTNADPNCSLYDSKTNLLDSDYGASYLYDNMKIVYNLIAGETYFIRAENYDSLSANTVYSYDINITAPSSVSNTNNLTRENAYTFSDNVNVRLAFGASARYYKFTASTSGIYTIESSNLTNADPYCSLYDSKTNLLYSDYGKSYLYDNMKIVYNLIAGETYFIRAGNYDSLRANTVYSYDINITAPTSVSNTNNLSRENAYEFSGNVNVQLAYGAATRYYKFTVANSGIYKIESSNRKNADPYCSLYDSKGNLLDYDYGKSYLYDDVKIEYNLIADETYYIKAENYDILNANTVYSYDLTITPPESEV
jgi:hypothetical protein